jgi:hypothetical protein
MRIMADTLNMNKESIHKVLSNDLDTKKCEREGGDQVLTHDQK